MQLAPLLSMTPMNSPLFIEIRYRGLIQVMKESGQWGAYAARNFMKGELLISSKLKDVNAGGAIKSSAASCAHSIQIDWNKHILMDLPARYLNHSCEPNVGVLGLNANGSYNFVALRDISCDEVCSLQFYSFLTTMY